MAGGESGETSARTRERVGVHYIRTHRVLVLVEERTCRHGAANR